MAAIDIRGLVVDRGGRRVLDGLSLEVAPGRITGLLGPSGSGKTTLMRCIVGVQRVAAGTVIVLGSPAGDLGLRSRVAYMTQAASVYVDLSVHENVTYFASVLGAGADAVERCTERVRLGPYANDLAGRLSGGQRARVSLAVALLAEPELLVLDEPTVGLDPVLRVELWEMFRALADAGATLIVSSHVMDEADRCDDIVLMRDGAVIAAEPRQQLLARTAQPDVEQAFLHLVKT